MNNQKGFTLIELLAVIVVLAIVTVLATSSMLPLGTETREAAFRLEATNAVKSAKTAKETYDLGNLNLDSTGTKSCYNKETKKMCFTIESLIDLGYYDLDDDDKETFKGHIDIDLTNSKKPKYTLYFKKNDEFRFVGLNHTNYDKNGDIDNDVWNESYESCSCN